METNGGAGTSSRISRRRPSSSERPSIRGRRGDRRAYRRLFHQHGRLNEPRSIGATSAVAERRFFNWFLEFPDVMDGGGFDCILGNPPFLGGQRLSGTFGKDYLEYLKYEYEPAGAIDLVGFFFRRNFDLFNDGGAMGLIATNTIAQGSTREGSLAVILETGGTINFRHSVSRSGPALQRSRSHSDDTKGRWDGEFLLDRKSGQPDQQLSVG